MAWRPRPRLVPSVPTGPSTRAGTSYSAAEHATWKTLFERQTQLLPGRACDEFVQGMRDLPIGPEQDPRLPPPVRRADAAHRLAGGRGAGAGAGRGVLRAPGPSALPVGPLHPQAARARLPRGARCLPRRLRPRADADEPGDRRLHPGLRRRRPARPAPGQADAAGAGVLVHGRVRPGAAGATGCASTARASPRRPPRACSRSTTPRRTASASSWNG